MHRWAEVHLTFNLIRCLSKALEDDLRRIARPYHLTGSQLHLLSLLYQEDGISISTIAQRGLWHISSAFHNVSKLEQLGLVVTKSNQEDERVTEVHLTEEGRRLFDTISQDVDQSRVMQAVRKLQEQFSEREGEETPMRIGLYLCETLAGHEFAQWLIRSARQWKEGEGQPSQSSGSAETQGIYVNH
ncbi:MAG: MarR family transcriptional regulator [Alicyclobacillaceae bacterium]|nr:MarR family transcriptional regulator [Alicyclobacillaceae bacterium]